MAIASIAIPASHAGTIVTGISLGNTPLEMELVELRGSNASLVNLIDTIDRANANPKIPPGYCRLYTSLISKYPVLLEGEPAYVQVHDIRAAAGWASKKTASAFFNSLVEIGAILYDSGSYDGNTRERTGLVTPVDEIFPFPENFDLRNTRDAKKARETEKQKRDELRAQLLHTHCPVCQSANLVYDIGGKCLDCGEKLPLITGIAAELITIENEAKYADVYSSLVGE